MLIALLLSFVLIFCVLFVTLKLIQIFTYKYYQEISENKDIEIEKEPDQIKFLQYNVFWRPFLLHIGKREYVKSRSCCLSKNVEKYDVLCLNEAFCFGSNTVSEFVERLKSVGFKYFVSNKPVKILSKKVIDSGVLIASKYPIIETSNITYSKGCSFDDFASKGAVYAKIKIGKDKTINVFSTHLQASYVVVTDVDYNVRDSQAKELQKFISYHIKNDSSPTFLLGDMNINSINEEREYQNLLKNLQVPLFKLFDTLGDEHPVTIAEVVDGKTVEPALTQNSDLNLPKSIDYIFYYQPETKQNSKFKSQINKFKQITKDHPYTHLSDHYAVECTYDLI